MATKRIFSSSAKENCSKKQFLENSYRGRQNLVRSSRAHQKTPLLLTIERHDFRDALSITEIFHFGSVINSKKLSIAEQSAAVKQVNLCFKCFTGKHCARDCNSKLKCGIDGCEINHNHMLHNRPTVRHEIIQSPDQISKTIPANETRTHN